MISSPRPPSRSGAPFSSTRQGTTADPSTAAIVTCSSWADKLQRQTAATVPHGVGDKLTDYQQRRIGPLIVGEAPPGERGLDRLTGHGRRPLVQGQIHMRRQL